MADKWESTQERVARQLRSLPQTNGTLKGRVAQATPVAPYDPTRRPQSTPFKVYVQPNEPDEIDYEDEDSVGSLWFDTDEPVP